MAAMKGVTMPHTASTLSCRAVVPFKQNTRRRHAFPCEAQKDSQQKAGNVLLSTGLALAISVGALLPPSALAEDTYAKRREDMERRKELLSKTRQKALAGGGRESSSEAPSLSAEASPGDGDKAESKSESSPQPSVSKIEEQKIKAATDEVNRTNAEREKEAQKMRKSMAGSLQQYESKSQKGEQKFKPGKPSKDFESPTFLKSFIEERQKDKSDSPSKASETIAPSPTTPPPPTPAPPSEPAKPAPLASKPSPSASSSSPSPTSGQGEGQKAPASESVQGTRLAASPAANPPKPTPPRNLPKPEPGPVIPSPTSLSKPKLGVQPVQKQQKTVESTKGKRRGPLPMTLVQILVLAAFGGLGYLTFFREEDVDRALAKSGSVIADVYGKLEKTVSKKAKTAKAEAQESQ